APELDETHPQYMEITDAMPTGIVFKITNDSGHDLDYHPQFIIMQDGEKVADTALPPDMIYVQNPIPQGVCGQQLSFAQLPAGSYTLVNLTEDGTAEGTLGHVDFEISAEYDNMVYIAEHKGEDYEAVEAELTSQGFQINKRSARYQGSGEFALDAGKVVSVAPEPYMTEQLDDNGTSAYYHYDGRGYWAEKGSTVDVLVSLGAENSEPVTVPYVVGQDFESAKIELLNLGFYIDKRSAYYDDIPAGTVAEETVNDRAVPADGLEAPIESCVRITVSLGKKEAGS
ncbi:MAG TPA: hypothetical protein DCG49_04345, partial [Ruminococcus sp.]|nr:hypothetical protein [Ruminococcus sp.]